MMVSTFAVGALVGAVAGFYAAVRFKREEFAEIEPAREAVVFAKSQLDTAASRLNHQADEMERERLHMKWAVGQPGKRGGIVGLD
jgi:hypothetical protein